MTISLSHGATTMYRSPAPVTELVVASMNGVVTLRQAAAGRWEVAARALAGKHVQAIFEEPRSRTLFAGCWNNGLHASEDGGATWFARDQNLPIRSVYSLNAAEFDGRTRLYAGTEPAHVFVSEDLGFNWRELAAFRDMPNVDKWRFAGEPFTGHAKHINFDPFDPRTIYVCVEVGAFIKSTDGGETWSFLPVPHPDMHRSVIDPRNTSRIFTTGGGGLQLSLDAGSTWRQILSRESPIGEYPDQLMLRGDKPDTMVMACAELSPRSWLERRYAGGAVAKSVDGGETWRLVQGGLPSRMHGATEAMCQVEFPGGAEYFLGTTDGDIWHGRDEGETWQRIATGVPVSKSIHQEMLTGHPVTPLQKPDGSYWAGGRASHASAA
jgi:photosystem II stability/assembly factor-like uncharacterized protein